jgi:ribosomal protein S18 acetylase RimI-like enzyme
VTGTSGFRPVSVRRLGLPDVQDYRAIRLSALDMEASSFSSTYAAEAAMPIEGHAERLGSSIVFGAYDADRIVGMIGFRREARVRNAHKGFVWGFFVAPSYRQLGVGAALMAALIDAARSCVEQVLLSVVAGNAAATAFYERFGFQRYGVEPRALRSDDGYADEALMVLFLDAAPPQPGPG